MRNAVRSTTGAPATRTAESTVKQKKPARECALTILERSDRTEAQLRQKLKEKEYAPEEIDETIDFLKEYRYVDDAAYAARYIRTCSSRKSVRQIRCDLERKGISKELIAEGLGENPVDEEEQVRRLLVKKGYQPGQRMEPDQYRKLMGALCRKGFSYEVIRRVTDRMCEEYDG